MKQLFVVYVFFAGLFDTGICTPSNLTFLLNDDSGESGSSEHQRNFKQAAVAADSPYCARISKDILARGGAVADATIAGLACMAAVHPQSSGIGGGFFAVHYDPRTKRSSVLNAREMSPQAATERMFEGREDEAERGGRAVAIPGEIKGYMELYKRFGGKVPWEDLFQPSIKLLRDGFRVDEHLANALRINGNAIKNEPSLREVFINSRTSNTYREGETAKFPRLADTFEYIAKHGGETFYHPDSPLAKAMVSDLQGFGAIATQEDFTKYSAKWQSPIRISVGGGVTMHTAPAPASGALMAFIFRILQNYRSKLKADDGDSLHLMVEAFKHAYGRRGKLGDPDSSAGESIRNHERNLVSSSAYLKRALNNIDEGKTSNDAQRYQDGAQFLRGNGTAAFSIIGPSGESLTVTTTINTYLGARIRSRRTGVVFNDQMADFALNSEQRGSNPANAVAGGKRPLSSACPVIFTDSQNRVVLSTGAAGGIKILSAVTFVSVNHLWYGKSLEQAVHSRRLHHTLDPMHVEVESDFADSLVRSLQGKGHRVYTSYRRTVVTSTARGPDGTLVAVGDPRKPSSTDGY